MLKATFTLLAALAVGMLGMADAQAVGLPVLVKPALQSDATSQIVDVRYNGGGHGGHHGGYHGNYRRPYYNHRPAHWNPRYGRRCTGWTNYCHYHYNGYWYSNQWWLGPAVGVGVGLAVAGATASANSSSRHVAWCQGRYKSYNPRNNTWISNSGQVKQCNSPYN